MDDYTLANLIREGVEGWGPRHGRLRLRPAVYRRRRLWPWIVVGLTTSVLLLWVVAAAEGRVGVAAAPVPDVTTSGRSAAARLPRLPDRPAPDPRADGSLPGRRPPGETFATLLLGRHRTVVAMAVPGTQATDVVALLGL